LFVCLFCSAFAQRTQYLDDGDGLNTSVTGPFGLEMNREYFKKDISSNFLFNYTGSLQIKLSALEEIVLLITQENSKSGATPFVVTLCFEDGSHRNYVLKLDSKRTFLDSATALDRLFYEKKMKSKDVMVKATFVCGLPFTLEIISEDGDKDNSTAIPVQVDDPIIFPPHETIPASGGCNLGGSTEYGLPISLSRWTKSVDGAPGEPVPGDVPVTAYMYRHVDTGWVIPGLLSYAEISLDVNYPAKGDLFHISDNILYYENELTALFTWDCVTFPYIITSLMTVTNNSPSCPSTQKHSWGHLGSFVDGNSSFAWVYARYGCQAGDGTPENPGFKWKITRK